MVCLFVSFSRSVERRFRYTVDQIPLGVVIPAIIMFYDLYGPFVPQMCVNKDFRMLAHY